MPTNCFHCKYYLAFTKDEARQANDMLARKGLFGSYWGACTFHSIHDSQFLVRLYLQRPIDECICREEGYFADPLNIVCPVCKDGFLVIRRPRMHIQTERIINCSRYPDCQFKSYHMRTNFLCTYCQIPVVLHVKDRFSIDCPRCKREVPFVFSVSSWPQIFYNAAYCPHGTNRELCSHCQSAQDTKKNLIFLELDEVVQGHQQRLEEMTHYPQEIDERQDNESYDYAYQDDNVEDEDLFEYESESYDDSEWREEMIQEYDSYNRSMARSHNSGWFYDDYEDGGYLS